MNFTSSMANTLVGSVIAIVSVAPARLSGTIWYLRAVSAGTSLMTAGIDLELVQRDRGHAVLLRQQRGDLLVFHIPQLDEVGAELAAVLALVVQRLLELFRRDALLFEKQLTNANWHFVRRQNNMRAPTLHERSRRGRARRALPATFPASILRRCPRRPPRARLRSCFAARRRASRAAAPSTTSRLPPPHRGDRRAGVGRDVTSPSTTTITREMPVHPDPQAPPT